MLMPIAAMDEDNFSPAYERQIGLTGQVVAMKPVSISKRANKPPYRQFRLHALTTDCPHIGAAALYRKLVGHALTLIDMAGFTKHFRFVPVLRCIRHKFTRPEGESKTLHYFMVAFGIENRDSFGG